MSMEYFGPDSHLSSVGNLYWTFRSLYHPPSRRSRHANLPVLRNCPWRRQLSTVQTRMGYTSDWRGRPEIFTKQKQNLVTGSTAGVRFPARPTDFSLFRNVHTSIKTHPAIYPIGSGRLMRAAIAQSIKRRAWTTVLQFPRGAQYFYFLHNV
jgi:hypothetical protein